jgi:hypothetical protein
MIEKNYTFPTDHRMMHKKEIITSRSMECMCALQGVHSTEAHAAESGYGSRDEKLNVYLKDIAILLGIDQDGRNIRRKCDDKVLQRVNDNRFHEPELSGSVMCGPCPGDLEVCRGVTVPNQESTVIICPRPPNPTF